MHMLKNIAMDTSIIIITRANKSRMSVIFDRTYYTNKYLMFLNDISTYMIYRKI